MSKSDQESPKFGKAIIMAEITEPIENTNENEESETKEEVNLDNAFRSSFISEENDSSEDRDNVNNMEDKQSDDGGSFRNQRS